jgi:NAD+ kinase
VTAGDLIAVRKHDHTLRLLHPPEHDYFAVLREKLRWSEQP